MCLQYMNGRFRYIILRYYNVLVVFVARIWSYGNAFWCKYVET